MSLKASQIPSLPLPWPPIVSGLHSLLPTQLYNVTTIAIQYQEIQNTFKIPKFEQRVIGNLILNKSLLLKKIDTYAHKFICNVTTKDMKYHLNPKI